MSFSISIAFGRMHTSHVRAAVKTAVEKLDACGVQPILQLSRRSGNVDISEEEKFRSRETPYLIDEVANTRARSTRTATFGCTCGTPTCTL